MEFTSQPDSGEVQPIVQSEVLLSEDFYSRWRNTGETLSLESDTEIAQFLLQHYEKTASGVQSGTACDNCCTPLTLFCGGCGKAPQLQASQNPPGTEPEAIEFTAPAADTLSEQASIRSYLSQLGVLDSQQVVSVQQVESSDPQLGAEGVQVWVCDIQPEGGDHDYSSRLSGGERPLVQVQGTREESLSVLEESGISASPVIEGPVAGNSGDEIRPDETSELSSSVQETQPEMQKLEPGDQKTSAALVCEHCGYSFTRASLWRRHMQTHKKTASSPGEAPDDGVDMTETSSSPEPPDHDTITDQNEEEDEPFVCRECNCSFKIMSELQAHSRMHMKDRPLEKIVKKQPCDTSDLQELGQTSERRHEFVCRRCDRGFRRAILLRQHEPLCAAKMSKSTRPGRKPGMKTPKLASERGLSLGRKSKSNDETCVGETGRNQVATSNHSAADNSALELPALDPAMVVSGEKLVDDSSLKFPESDEMIKGSEKTAHRHEQLVPDKEKTFACQLCDQKFERKEQLTDHAQIHTGLAPFVCASCGTTFSGVQDLHQHTRLQECGDGGGANVQRKQVCYWCKATFTSRQDYKKHLQMHKNEKPYKCEECDFACNRLSTLKKHCTQKHPEDKPFACPQCDLKFALESKLHSHMRTHGAEYQSDKANQLPSEGLKEDSASESSEVPPTEEFEKTARKPNKKQPAKGGERPFVCKDCGRGFKQKGHLTDHEKIHLGVRPFMCESCGIAFVRMKDLRMHKRHQVCSRLSEGDEGSQRRRVCYWCKEVFVTWLEYRKHLQSHNGEKIHRCKECSFTCARPSTLKEHVALKHSQEKPFACTLCSAKFAVKRRLLLHMSAHGDAKPFACQCGALFKRKSCLMRHQVIHDSGAKFTCSECSKTFCTASNLRDHELCKHSSERPFSCPQCGARFALKSRLNVHVKLRHNTPKSFVCEVCAAAFLQRAGLARHMLKHTGERPFLCPDCGKSFPESGKLSMHRRIHTGERNHRCTICGASFTAPAILRGHMKLHSGNVQERPYECSECQVRFTVLSKLKCHMTRWHSGKKFSCPSCSAEFAIKDSLTRHMKKYHQLHENVLESMPQQDVIVEDEKATVQLQYDFDPVQSALVLTYIKQETVGM